MDTVTAYVATVLAFFLFSIPLLRLRRTHLRLRLPPSPAAIPFLGHLHLVEKPLHATLARLAGHYGPVFSFRLGSRDVVAVCSAACAKQCFTEHDVTFASRPQFPSLMVVSFGCTDLPTCPYGAYWRQLRRVATVELLSAHRVGYISGDIANEVHAMVSRLARAAPAGAGAALVKLKRSIFEISVSALMETIAQTRTSRTEADVDMDMSPEAQELKEWMDEIIPLMGAANTWDFLPPVLWWLDVFGVRRKLLAAVGRRDAFIQRLIDIERLRLDSGGSESTKKSMIARLLSLQKTEPETYTDNMILALCSVNISLMFPMSNISDLLFLLCCYVIYAEHVQCGHRDDRYDAGMGDVAAAQPSGHSGQGAGRD